MARKSSVTGGKATAKRLRQVVPGLAVPLNEASRKALAPMLRMARTTAPRDSGALRKTLIIKRSGRSPKIRPVHLVGPRADYELNGRRPVKYAHVVEFGRAPNADGKGGMEGSRFMSKAFDATAARALQILGIELPAAIEKRVKKLASKGGSR